MSDSKNEKLYCCFFEDLSHDKDLLPDLLLAVDFTDQSSRLDAESGTTMITLYFPESALAESAAEKLESFREDWKDLGIEFGKIQRSEICREDWAESWKIHFKPIEISKTLAVTPDWINFKAAPGQTVILLNPGMSFGTGQHATTKFCLSQLDSIAHSGDVSKVSMLDAGCGSGILAIAARKLGFGDVAAFDIDPDAVEISKENAAMNHAENIEFAAAPLIEYNAHGRTYDVVAANILSSALLAGRDKLMSLLKPGGTLILAGILDTEYQIVRKAFEEKGLTQVASVQETQWRGGRFESKNT